jgi:hypothetical protein
MYGAGDVRVEDVPDPVIVAPTDAVVRVVRSAICGRLGAEQVILIGRHTDWTTLGVEFGATDVILTSGEEGAEEVRKGPHHILNQAAGKAGPSDITSTEPEPEPGIATGSTPPAAASTTATPHPSSTASPAATPVPLRITLA